MSKILLFLGLSVFASNLAFGSIQMPGLPPDELAQVSDCIVVGHAKDNSLDHPVLVVTEVLKGTPPASELPIIMNDGLALREDHTIWQLGKMGQAICGNIHQDQIWFLRRDLKLYSVQQHGKGLGIWEMGDVQPVDLKPFYLAFLSGDTENELRLYVYGDSLLAKRCRVYLDPIDIARISKIPNPANRIDMLIPYLLFRELFNPKENDETVPNSETMPTVDPENVRENDAQKQLISCGKGVGEKLAPIFLDPKYEYMRMEIMNMWAALDYKEATPLIISLLEQEDKHWAHPDVPNPIDNDRANSWSRLRISRALRALATLRDPRAKQIILQTKKRWVAFGPADPSQTIVPMCDAALKAIDAPAEPN